MHIKQCLLSPTEIITIVRLIISRCPIGKPSLIMQQETECIITIQTMLTTNPATVTDIIEEDNDKYRFSYS